MDNHTVKIGGLRFQQVTLTNFVLHVETSTNDTIYEIELMISAIGQPTPMTWVLRARRKSSEPEVLSSSDFLDEFEPVVRAHDRAQCIAVTGASDNDIKGWYGEITVLKLDEVDCSVFSHDGLVCDMLVEPAVSELLTSVVYDMSLGLMEDDDGELE